MKTAIVILAAGSSSRLGRPKQSLVFKGKTLLQSAIDQALSAALGPVIVILGAAGSAAAYTSTPLLTYVDNPNWQAGMSSSIRTGIEKLNESFAGEEIENVILAVCDQVFMDSGILRGLHECWRKSEKSIVASAYGGSLGTPVLFNSKYFSELCALEGVSGAKKLIMAHQQDLEWVDFEKGGIDIDSPGDYERLLSESDPEE